MQIYEFILIPWQQMKLSKHKLSKAMQKFEYNLIRIQNGVGELRTQQGILSDAYKAVQTGNSVMFIHVQLAISFLMCV